MNQTNTKPDFTSIWNSKRRPEKSKLKAEFCKACSIKSDVTFFNKKKDLDYSPIEQEWWAKKLGYPVEQLFPIK